MRKSFLLILLFLIKINSTLADTFVVTSNADSGAGSLREAITLAAANGILATDSIVFNITDTNRAARTITIGDQLPDLSSNLIIDATTQQGSKIGKSDAKIILLLSTIRTKRFYFFTFTSAKNIQIYGLFFYKNFSTMFNVNQAAATGIRFTNCNDIVVGKPGKGNYFRGVDFGIDNSLLSYNDDYKRNSTNIIIQSNVFGYNENGYPSIQDSTGSFFFIDPVVYAVYSFNSKDILIGGNTELEGNLFYAEKLEVRSDVQENGSLIFKNNKAGTKTDGTIVVQQNIPEIKILFGSNNRWPYTPSYKIDIVNNVINGGIEVSYNSGYLTVQGNKLFSPNNSSMGSTFNLKLNIYLCTGGGIIGGDLPGQQNEIFTRACLTTSNSWNSSILLRGIAISSSPKIAIVKNITYASAVNGAGIEVVSSFEPKIRIDSTAINFVKGNATPGCRIEVFLDDGCWACDGEVFLGRTTSNTDSSWSFTGTFNGVVIATATKPDSTTSGYTAPIYRLDTVKIVQPTCGLANGSVKGIYGFESTDSMEWHKLTFNLNGFPYIRDSLVATTPDLLNAQVGTYYFVAKLGQTCHSASFYYTFRDYTPAIDVANVSVTQPSCGLFNGTISHIRINNGDYSTYKWVNDQNVIFPNGEHGNINDAFVNNLPSGRYRLIVTDNRNGCADTSKFFTLTNQSGPSLATSTAQIKLATCGEPNGSITGITASNTTGIQFIQWTDSVENIVGSSFNLLNRRAGKYRLRFKDQGSCDTIVTPFFVVKDTSAIVINAANKIVAPAGCTVNNGSISNITVTNASSYTWKNMNGFTLAGNSLNISRLSSGFYQLTASNALGCSANSNGIFIPNATFDEIRVVNFDLKNGGCNNADGRISISNFSKNASSYTFRWVDSSSNRQLGTGTSVSGLGKGVYILLATDSNGCEKKIFSQFVDSLPTPLLSFAGMVITNDVCGRKQGSITGITVKYLKGPTTYQWLDINNTVFGNELILKNIGAGQYGLYVQDAGCGIATSLLTISNDLNAGTTPQYNDVIVAKNSPATFTVNNFEPGTYILYSDAIGSQELKRNTTGSFTTAAISGNINFYVKHITGNCSSQLAKISVTAIDNSYFIIPKAFTPNVDQINDKLTVRVVGYIKLIYFKVYNRYGQVVFETSMINDTWDGKFKGNNLPNGAYIWIAAGSDITGRIIRDKGTIMILH